VNKNLPSISEECIASLAAAASLTLSKVTNPKPRERVGFSLRTQQRWVHATNSEKKKQAPVHRYKGIGYFAMSTECFKKDILVGIPGQIADVAVKRVEQDW
jgi:hypothetical protein